MTDKQEVIRAGRKLVLPFLPTLDGDNWQNQGFAAPKSTGEVAKSISQAGCGFNLSTVCLV
jgi:hypothetical protein